MEAFGGFHTLQYDQTASFSSPLAFGAQVRWHRVRGICISSASQASVDLKVCFAVVDWQFAQSVYGWAGLQFQAWARGTLKNTSPSPQRIVLFTDQVLEFWINDQHIFGGDFYAFRRAPLVVTLDPGDNTINIRLIRDVRAMGAIQPPDIVTTLRAVPVAPDLSVAERTTVVSDLVGNRLPSPFASFVVRNQSDAWIVLGECLPAEVSVSPAFAVSSLNVSG